MRLPLFDMDEIYPGLWQGGVPLPGTHLRDGGFALLVLCAKEYQPSEDLFPGVRVLHAPNIDNEDILPSRGQLRVALEAARIVAQTLRDNGKVLVTCWAGINRSGLVTGLALNQYLGISGIDACLQIKRQRPEALTNAQFVDCLTRLPRRVVLG